MITCCNFLMCLPPCGQCETRVFTGQSGPTPSGNPRS
jgi:hypothetical protein